MGKKGEDFMKFILFVLASILVIMLYGCTYSITMVHTEGTASDVVDETQTSKPDVKADVALPLARSL